MEGSLFAQRGQRFEPDQAPAPGPRTGRRPASSRLTGPPRRGQLEGMTLGRTITLKDLTDGGKAAMAEALAVLESAPDAAHTIALLDAAYAAPRGRVIGVTGPPGVGKSTLLGAIIPRLREAGR